MAVEGWETKRLDQIGDIYSGSTPSTTNQDYWDGDIVWITPNDLSSLNTPYLRTSNKKITKKGLESCSTQLLPAGSITISSRAPIGYVAIPTVEFCTNQGCKSIKLKSGYDSEFMYYNINFHIDKLKKLGEGTTFAEISKAAISSIQIPFPKVKEEQSQVAAILSTIDKAIEQTEALIVKQQRIKTGLMQDLLTCGIDEHGNIRSEETHAFKDSPLGRIPVEWDVRTLGELCSLVTDGKHGDCINQGLSGYYFISAKDIENGQLLYEDARQITKSDFMETHKRTNLQPGDILMSNAGSIGKIAIASDNPITYKTTFQKSVAIIKPIRTGINPVYLSLVFNHARKDLEDLARGSSQKNLLLGDLSKFSLQVPGNSEQERIAAIFNTFDEILTRTASGLTKLKRMKAGLMQDLLTGKVRVTRLLRNLSVRKTTP